MLHELGELAKVVRGFADESVGIIHGDRMQKLLGTGDLGGADKDENYNDCTLEYIVMPLIDSLQISLGIVERKETDTLYIMDSMTLHKNRTELHRKAAIRILSSRGNYNSKQLKLKHLDSSPQSNCGIFAIRYFRVFFEYGQDEVDAIVDFEITRLRSQLHESMRKLIVKPQTETSKTLRNPEKQPTDEEVLGKKKLVAKELDFDSSDDDPLLKEPANPPSAKKPQVQKKTPRKASTNGTARQKCKQICNPRSWQL